MLSSQQKKIRQIRKAQAILRGLIQIYEREIARIGG